MSKRVAPDGMPSADGGTGVPPRVALLPWGDVFEDWLDPLGVSLEELRDELTGSWMFGYASALATAGVDTLIVCVTGRVDEPVRWTHGPTGAGLALLPPTRAYAVAAGAMLREPVDGRRDPRTIARAAVRHVAPYLATPVSAVVRLLRRERCAAILCQEYESPRFDACVLAGARTNLPVFATFQGGDYHVSRLEAPVRPRTIRRAAGLIVATTSEAQRVRRRYGVPSDRLHQIFNPVDVDRWRTQDRASARRDLEVDDDTVVVAWHGQLQLRRKGLDVLLDAWVEVVRARPSRSLCLLLVGSGADATLLRRSIAERGIDGIRHLDTWLHGPERLAGLLSAADLYVFPSRHEGFPLAPVEAMSCGLPVVAADAQGIADILRNGPESGGLVVPRGDAVALAQALGELVDDPERRRELGRRARERAVAAFSPAAVGTKLRDVLVGTAR